MAKAMTDKELLEVLNKLRTNAKLPAIKFSGTRAQLVAFVEQAKKGKFDMGQAIDKVTPARGRGRPRKEPLETVEKKPSAKPAPAAKGKAAKAPAPTRSRDIPKGQFSIAGLARELGIDPKLARSKARRHADRLPKSVAKHVYEDKYKSAVTAIISSSRQ